MENLRWAGLNVVVEILALLCRLGTEHEASQHAELKLTWQRANEQFLDLQKTLEAKCSMLERQVRERAGGSLSVLTFRFSLPVLGWGRFRT
jgi:hypothetical protein